MTTERSQPVPAGFTQRILPWFVGGGGLLIFLATLNPWVSLNSLGTVARISGWLWRPTFNQPLTWLVLLPFRLFPEPWLPLVLNLFTAACAALVLTLLARSVALLPHDLTPVQRFGRSKPAAILSTLSAWMPPVLAAILCSLQLSFWEHATSATGEIIDLLVFAYVIRCLLEFRVSQNDVWLFRCVCVYGAGMANNWIMVGYLPIFLAALLRLKGFGLLFNRPLLLRLALWGGVGLSLYLLLPAVQGIASQGQVDFWTAFKANVKFQKDALRSLRLPAIKALALTSVLPLLILSVRWKSHTAQFGDDTPLGVFLTKATGHFVHGVVLACAIWFALDPSFSPRHLGLGGPQLTCYYLSALLGGYCAGYFLLFAAKAPHSIAGRAAVAATGILLGVAPLVLGWRNLSQVRFTNGSALRQFARELHGDLPLGASVVLGDDPAPFLLLQAEAATRSDKDPLFLDTRSLGSAEYLRLMAGRYPLRWPGPGPTNQTETIGPARLLGLLSRLAAREPVISLRPNFGLVLERFEESPRGLVHELTPRVATGSRLQGSTATNELVWEERWSNHLAGMASRSHWLSVGRPPSSRGLARLVRLETERNGTAVFLGATYARSLNCLGVALQRADRWPGAGAWLDRSLALNPENLAARINQRYNSSYQRGDKTRLNPVAIEKEWKDLFDKYRNWDDLLSANGPMDEPSFLFRGGRVSETLFQPRQAADQFARCVELSPEWPQPKLWLAQCQVELGNFSGALELTDRIAAANLNEGAAVARLLHCRSKAFGGLGKTNEAIALVEEFLGDYRKHEEVVRVAVDLYADGARFEPQLALIEELLRRDPSQAALLAKKGVAQLELGRFEAAITSLTAALAATPADENARLSRAIAYLSAGQLDPARADYEQLLQTRNQVNALFGLGTVAWRKHDTNSAMDYYKQYLAKAIPRTRQYALASERLKEMQGGGAN